jgi:hypothetical protein
MNVEHGADLSALDRNTLRTWRVLNLVGWGAVGMVANVLLLVGMTFFVDRFGELPNPFSWIVAETLFGLAGAGAGTVVAANVYRSPAFVAGFGAALLWLLAVVYVTSGDIGIMALSFLVFFPNIACAAFVAHRRWTRRPSALRSPA